MQDHRPTDILLSWLPYSHIYARVIDHYLTTLGESLVCLAESFDALRGNLSEVKPTWMTAVPRFYEKIWSDVESFPDGERNEELHRIFGPRLRHLSAGGAPLPVHVAEGFAARGNVSFRAVPTPQRNHEQAGQGDESPPRSNPTGQQKEFR